MQFVTFDLFVRFRHDWFVISMPHTGGSQRGGHGKAQRRITGNVQP
jgi:hypothetical protein